MNIRKATYSDTEDMARLYTEHYQKEFPLYLDNAFYHSVAEEDGKILGFGWLELIVEATVILDKNMRDRTKFAALRELINDGVKNAEYYGFDQIHAFSGDERFHNILCKHYGFVPSLCAVRNMRK